jgi:hypothetical protein
MLEGTLLDKGLHLVTVAASAALLTVSYTAYRKKGNRKFMYICLAFAVFAVKEAIIAINALHLESVTLTAAAHILNLAILGLFFKGTVS